MPPSASATAASKPVRPRPLWLKEYALFVSVGGKRWSSDVAWARVLYKPASDKIVILERTGQRPTDYDEDTEWAKPRFPDESMERLLQYARRCYEVGYERPGNQPASKKKPLKGHKSELCEMCQKRGGSCAG
jgi:hypothetical protein